VIGRGIAQPTAAAAGGADRRGVQLIGLGLIGELVVQVLL
jgi:hypothetical protein